MSKCFFVSWAIIVMLEPYNELSLREASAKVGLVSWHRMVRFGEENAGSSLVDINWPYPVLWFDTTSHGLRVNGSILNHLRALNKRYLECLRWIGLATIGYLYCLADQNGLYVAKSIDVLNIPTSVSGMAQFKNTLRLVFAYKHSILRTGLMTEHGLNERQYVDRLREVIDVSVVTPEPSTHHDIFFTPTNSRVKKVEITRE